MRERGQAEVDRAQADGRWDRAYAGSATATVPEDLVAALDAAPAAAALFAELDATNRCAVLHRVMTAPNATTRAARLAKLVGMLDRGETPYPRADTLTSGDRTPPVAPPRVRGDGVDRDHDGQDTTKRPADASGTFRIGGDLEVNRLGYGTMQLTGPGVWGPPKDREKPSACSRAVELGVNLFDTADAYGPYVTEELIGRRSTPTPTTS